MLRTPQKKETQTHSLLSAVSNRHEDQQQTQQIDKMKLDRMLRQKRSVKYMDALHRLDAGGHVHNQQKVDEIINAIREEFPEVHLAGILIGIVSVCYLGKPYEVHTLSFGGGIIEHYKKGEPLPDGMEKARNIAMRGGYDFIEVYADCCRAVSSNGVVSVISC